MGSTRFTVLVSFFHFKDLKAWEMGCGSFSFFVVWCVSLRES